MSWEIGLSRKIVGLTSYKMSCRSLNQDIINRSIIKQQQNNMNSNKKWK